MLADGFPAADTNRAGQIATGFSWKFYAVCDLDTAARFDGLSTVKISVPGKQNTPLSATVEEVTEDKDNGIAKIVLQCQTISAEVLGLGCETVQVDLKTYEGIRIDKAALHIVNGQRGVYVKYGNLQRFLKITTLYENDSYILVPEDGKLGSANEVRSMMRSSCRAQIWRMANYCNENTPFVLTRLPKKKIIFNVYRCNDALT